MTAPETAASGGVIDPDGVVCVWSASNLLERPEFVFTCSSQVTSVAFANFQPTMLVGGTYNNGFTNILKDQSVTVGKDKQDLKAKLNYLELTLGVFF